MVTFFNCWSSIKFTTFLFSICVTVVVLNVHFRSPQTHRMAPWVKRVFINFLPKFLFIKRPTYNFETRYKSQYNDKKYFTMWNKIYIINTPLQNMYYYTINISVYYKVLYICLTANGNWVFSFGLSWWNLVQMTLITVVNNRIGLDEYTYYIANFLKN